MLFAILTIVGGLIAASSLIIARKPNSKVLFEKVAPYQGFLGLGLLGYGLLSSLLAKSETAAEKGRAALARLVRIQVPMGLMAMVVGCLILFRF